MRKRLARWLRPGRPPVHVHIGSVEGSLARPPHLRKRSMYEDLRDRGAGYCHHCGAVVTPDDLKKHPIQPAPGVDAKSRSEKPA